MGVDGASGWFQQAIARTMVLWGRRGVVKVRGTLVSIRHKNSNQSDRTFVGNCLSGTLTRSARVRPRPLAVSGNARFLELEPMEKALLNWYTGT